MVRGVYFFFLLIMVAVSAGAGEIPESTNNNKNHFITPVVNERTEYYDICGLCEKDIECDLREKCIKWTDGKKYDSVTNWKVKWDYGHSRTPQTCTTESFVVTVDIVYQLPKWVRTGEAPRTLVKKWDRYMEKLMLHERGHSDRAVAAAKELMRTVAALPPANTCDELDWLLNTLFRARLDKLIEDQRAYDADTNHGILQGAVFP